VRNAWLIFRQRKNTAGQLTASRSSGGEQHNRRGTPRPRILLSAATAQRRLVAAAPLRGRFLRFVRASTRLVQASTRLVEGSTLLVQRSTLLVQRSTLLVQRSTLLVQRSTLLVQRSTLLVQRSTRFVPAARDALSGPAECCARCFSIFLQLDLQSRSLRGDRSHECNARGRAQANAVRRAARRADSRRFARVCPRGRMQGTFTAPRASGAP
jgi:hypothetical protein